ncbi:MAG: type III pantothenate kinase [Chitinispirillaceae bacterium]|nr:type III pantothenate kinase [Chitinispirillaceae bacterium]
MSAPEPLVYAIDIGNTRVHCGLVNYSTMICLHKEIFPAYNLQKSICGVLSNLEKKSGISNRVPIIVSGGTHSSFLSTESQLCEKGYKCRRFKYTTEMPFTLQYKNTPGADRIAHALYATVGNPGHNHIIISAGTAVTVDLIASNQFLGGTIFPGVSTQLKSLSVAAPLLPEVPPDGLTPLPGDSTETCIRSGVLFGIAGGIQAIISRYLVTFPDSVITATGGDWPYLSKLIDTEFTFNEDITLTGIALSERFCSQQ